QENQLPTTGCRERKRKTSKIRPRSSRDRIAGRSEARKRSAPRIRAFRAHKREAASGEVGVDPSCARDDKVSASLLPALASSSLLLLPSSSPLLLAPCSYTLPPALIRAQPRRPFPSKGPR